MVASGRLMRALLFVAASIILISAAASAQAQEHPFPLPLHIRTLFNEYTHKHNLGAFAISLDGRAAGYVYCQVAQVCGRRGRTERAAVDRCLGVSNGVRCRVYAWRGKIVWDGPPIQPAGRSLDATAPPIPPEGPSRPAKLIKCRLPDGILISMVPQRCFAVSGEEAE